MSCSSFKLSGIEEYEESDSEDAYDDVLARSRAASAHYGVRWDSFVEGSTQQSRIAAFFTLKALIQDNDIAKWYIGVTFCPVHRFYHGEPPHKLNYDAMFVLYLGTNLGRFERNWLQVVQKVFSQECLSKCQNKGKGGERVKARSVRYLYLCLSYIMDRTGGTAKNKSYKKTLVTTPSAASSLRPMTSHCARSSASSIQWRVC